jgi:hypothetical protein
VVLLINHEQHKNNPAPSQSFIQITAQVYRRKENTNRQTPNAGNKAILMNAALAMTLPIEYQPTAAPSKSYDIANRAPEPFSAARLR